MLQLHGGLGLGLGLVLVLGFYSVRHLMNGCDLKYTFPHIVVGFNDFRVYACFHERNK